MVCRRWGTFLVPALLAVVLAGCGPRSVKITGTLLKGGKPMVVPEDTYVTLSFIPESSKTNEKEGDPKAKSYSAKFDQKTGTYSVELPAGRYRTKLIIALPSKSQEKVNAPTPPIDSLTTYDLKKSQTLDIEVPAK